MARGVIVFLLVLLLAATGLNLIATAGANFPRVTSPLRQEVYVWQRAWTEPVCDAVTAHAREFSRVVVLERELLFKGDKTFTTEAAVSWPVLKATGGEVGLALRIGAFAGPFDENDATSNRIALEVRQLLDRAKTHGLSIAEVQLDFDAATSKLGGYLRWVRRVRRELHDVPLTITALPSWMSSPAFDALARATDGFVLQVHSLERPTVFGAKVTLCRVRDVPRWLARAERVGVPFRLALPTYAYRLLYDRKEQFLGLTAEGPALSVSEGTRVRTVWAEPEELAPLVRELNARRPSRLSSVLWYRMPVTSDALNWGWETLSAVREGRVPASKVRATIERDASGASKVVLINEGGGLPEMPLRLLVAWDGSRLLAADAFAGFRVLESSRTTVTFAPFGMTQTDRLVPHQPIAVGWFRLLTAPESSPHVQVFP